MSPNTSTHASRASSVDRSSPLWRARSAIARSMRVVVTGNSIANATAPKKPLTPPLTPASSEDALTDGGRVCRVERPDCQFQAIEHGELDRAIELSAGALRHHAQQFVDRLPGIFGEPRREIWIFQENDRAPQGLFVHRCERRVSIRIERDQRRHSKGRSPLRLARIAEPLLSMAVATGLIRPLGKASPRASVLSPATIA